MLRQAAGRAARRDGLPFPGVFLHRPGVLIFYSLFFVRQ
ncbi:hypothetical protein BN134_1677 [Cronobacter dublinensis 1210]|uniref:Uncharacterized protein n=1 Tax=Cronobacter dublinensis 1210 TaxID=1208656 RepID=A0ABM9Q662_9ENTR|nr:hypothetical protein BN134_1677 [Cronobacter dublinensis 1210]